MIRVAHLFPYFSLQYGGPVMVLLELCKYFKKYPINSTVYTASEINDSATIRTNSYQQLYPNLIIKRFKSYLRFRDYRICLGLIPTLLKDSDNIDIFHSHALRSFQEDSAALVAILKRKKFIITTHGNLCANSNYFQHLYKRIYDLSNSSIKNKLLDINYIAIAKVEIKFLRKYGIEDDKIHFIPHGIDTDFFKPTNPFDIIKKYNLQGLTNKKKILYVGRIDQRKGIDVLINSVALLKDEIPESYLLIIGGETDYKKKLLRLIKKLGIADRVKFLGFIPKIELPQVYSLVNVVVYPSKFEIFGVVITEANACEKVVIASNHWGPKEIIIDGKTGFLTKFGDVNELKEKLVEVLNNENLQIKMGKFAREHVKKHYNWEYSAQKYFKLYKKVLE